MQDYTEYLASHVLNDSETINYRMLSRALKIHSNRAKKCLYDYYTRQTQRKPESVYATYLLTGKRKAQALSNGTYSQHSEDLPMPSSPFPSSSAPEPSQGEEAPPVWTKVILLAKEADLESAKSSMDELESIHIYSLSPGAPSDLFTLGECTRRVMVDYATEDPLEKWAQYGVIQNENVWRRTRKGQPMPAPSVAVAEPVAPKAASVATIKKEESTKSDTAKSETAASAASSTAAAAATPSATTPATKKPIPTLKKERSSIMSSFARTQPPKPKAAAAPEDDTPALSDEDADDDEADGMDLDTSTPQPVGKTKHEREEELRQMMDMDDAGASANVEQDDTDMADAPVASQPEVSGTDSPAADDQEDDDTDAIDAAPADTKSEAADAAVRVENGRRRGRRRVMKKRTVKDEEGYLVTKEEAAWESFSEEDAPPPAKRNKPVIAAPAQVSKKAAGAKGQSGIMSFFVKR
ncbi:hypothetical protein ANO11243_030940 [Dothideomycetidae sp. 11243]|nr:hypothetical protein ANO11243_030940 [fungal sp. No.11243]